MSVTRKKTDCEKNMKEVTDEKREKQPNNTTDAVSWKYKI